jgi:tetratricopeptide (TPR) repeat protein
MAFFLLGRALNNAGGPQQALPLLQEASRRFKAIAKERQYKEAEGMVLICLGEQGHCLLALGQFADAAAASEECIRQAKQRGDMRGVAVGKSLLGFVHLERPRPSYPDALEAYQEAREIFSRLNEPGSLANSWHQIGRVHQGMGEPLAAEKAYNQSLAIKVRLSNPAEQASTLCQLGILYADNANVLQQPEQAVAFFEQAVAFFERAEEIYRTLGNTARVGLLLNNHATALLMLQRYEAARAIITRAIQCKEAYGHSAAPWTSWNILADIETKDGNPSAAAEARQQAMAAYLAYRRNGGENQYGSGPLALAIRQSLAAGTSAKATSLLQQLAAKPDWAETLPFINALRAITAGSRDRSLADNPSLSYYQAVEVVLLIEALEAGAGE